MSKMAAVFRVKRRLDEEPSEALILNCKKRKTDPDSDSNLSAFLKFAGTVKTEENVLSHIKKYTNDDTKSEFKKHTVNLTDKLRLQKREESKNARYKIVNCYRSNLNDDLENSEVDEKLTIFDIETDCNENSKTVENKNTTSEPDYVYDLYYTNSDDLGDANLEEYVSVCPLDDPLLFGTARENGLQASDSECDSEDSNAENNWRNDYPDESDLESVNENDMVEAMQNVDIKEDLLSSDSGEEGFVYSIDSEAAGFEEDIDESDVQRYGERYARFKARNKIENIESSGVDKDLYYGDIDEEEYYY
ncbi:unnamed protein product [Brassicogethes aeneus]|uniref:Probable RNA polymerase II nuclear localization protein SLC7A6OS n=1 Tax=Brassicogethes aeneus TaxID=1431903 RepID=A0A9P0FHM3_BRAAE|nr:unnamed protein product [Brassicogethes aeneus]